MENSRGGRVKVVGIPGGTPKIEGKNMDFPGGSMQKNGKFQGGHHGKFDWKSRGSTPKNRYPKQGGYNFFLEKPMCKKPLQ